MNLACLVIMKIEQVQGQDVVFKLTLNPDHINDHSTTQSIITNISTKLRVLYSLKFAYFYRPASHDLFAICKIIQYPSMVN